MDWAAVRRVVASAIQMEFREDVTDGRSQLPGRGRAHGSELGIGADLTLAEFGVLLSLVAAAAGDPPAWAGGLTRRGPATVTLACWFARVTGRSPGAAVRTRLTGG